MGHGPQFDKAMLYLASSVPPRKTFIQRKISAAHQADKVFDLKFRNG